MTAYEAAEVALHAIPDGYDGRLFPKVVLEPQLVGHVIGLSVQGPKAPCYRRLAYADVTREEFAERVPGHWSDMAQEVAIMAADAEYMASEAVGYMAFRGWDKP